MKASEQLQKNRSREEMAKIALENWKEAIRDPKIECMSRDEMSALQSERLVKQVKNMRM